METIGGWLLAGGMRATLKLKRERAIAELPGRLI